MSDELPSSDVFESVPGGRELLEWFGEVPSFHDAEILDLHLSRSGGSTLRIHTWKVLPESGPEERPPFKKHALVTFTLEEIVGLDLEDFSAQNVISGLELKRLQEDKPSFGMTWLEPPPSPPEFYEIILKPCYGLAGIIRARRVSISLTPGEPSDRNTR